MSSRYDDEELPQARRAEPAAQEIPQEDEEDLYYEDAEAEADDTVHVAPAARPSVTRTAKPARPAPRPQPTASSRPAARAATPARPAQRSTRISRPIAER